MTNRMPQQHKLRTPLSETAVAALRAGDSVLLSGVIYTARDAAHKRIVECIDSGGRLPFELSGQVIYYTGPTPTPPGKIIGSAGPTTSYRMDGYAPRLFELGLRATIGKGPRSPEVLQAMVRHRAVYLIATGGAGALLAGCVRACRVIAYADLGPEAVHELEVKDFPVLVANDIHGGDIYARSAQK